MYKILCLNNISQVGLSHLTDEFELTDDIAQADAILVRSADMLSMDIPDNVKVIARAGAGYNNIPTAALAERGIPVFNTPGANANGVKELVLCGMLLAARDVLGGIEWCKENADDPAIGKSAEKAKKAFAGGEIIGKTLGVIGLGAIGKLVVRSAEALGMKTIGYDPYLPADAAAAISPDMTFTAELADIYQHCDYITIHVPAMDSTKNMVNAGLISQMKPGAVVLNFARNTIVDEQAMAAALAEGHIARYVTDFPPPVSADMKNAIVLPHLGASTTEAEENCAVMAAEELRDFIENGNITHSVNFGAVDLGPIASGERLAIIHQNVQGMIGKFSQYLADSGINIENMANKSRGAMAYTLIDIAGEVPTDVIDYLAQAEGVRRIRVIRA